ncbi:hypothetical protein OE88DRAFT_717814 [Heliocybe sulcata]|uniref:HBS1-like protein N-terminal domain-containing protein n=1 Tax=Heliocybe sulcata TaxID=5364 RepID=A0A5C3NFN7_9AGAM|nr:hypothetical protein OE88DRAFT_717814 [Heliocybe sulcata]
MNIQDELDDDAGDFGEDELTPEQEEQMAYGLEQVRHVVGSERESGLDDEMIKNALWDQYFDVERTLQLLLEEQERRRVAQERKAFLLLLRFSLEWTRQGQKSLPPIPAEEDEAMSDTSSASPGLMQRASRPVIPVPIPYEGDAGEYYEEFSEASTPRPPIIRLSTITERTERTEESTVGPRLSAYGPRMSMTSTVDYGQPIESKLNNPEPNVMPPSPSLSALQYLSIIEPAPSLPRSESASPPSTPTPPRSPPPPVPPIEAIPDIPDYPTASARGAPPSPQHPPRRPSSTISEKTEKSDVTVMPKRQSKLSALASSRSRPSMTSMTSRTTTATHDDRTDAESFVTYPALRPSPASQMSLVPSEVETTSTSMSSHVRRAIQTALELERQDKEAAEGAFRSEAGSSSRSGMSLGQSSPSAQGRSVTGSQSTISSRSGNGKPPSKLALMAQAKAKQGSQYGPKPKTQPRSPSPRSMLHEARTEYLTPVANGATATTAITTQYQTLYNLIPPKKSGLPPSYPAPEKSSSELNGKQSKLAMKARSRMQQNPSPSPEEEEPVVLPDLQLFSSKTTRSRSSGSSPSAASTASGWSHARHRDKPMPAIPTMAEPSGFAFDSPSPDDMVHNARRGTSLAQQHSRKPASAHSSSRSSSSSVSTARPIRPRA